MGDDDAVALLVDAGQQAGQPPSTLARLNAFALRMLAGEADGERRLGLLVALAGALVFAGRLTESIDALSEALVLLPPHATARRAQVARLLSVAESFLGRAGSAQHVLERAIVDRERERVPLMVELAVTRWRSGDLEDAMARGVDALVAARRQRDVAAAAAAVALMESIGCRTAQARTHADDAGAILDGLSYRELSDHLVALFHLSAAEAGLGQHQAAIRHGERGLAIARATGQALLVVPFTLVVGSSQLRVGQFEPAARSAEEMLSASSLLANDQYLSWSWALRSSIALVLGDLTGAMSSAEQAVAYTQKVPQGLFGHLSHGARAAACLAARESERAITLMLDRAGGPELPRLEPSARVRWYVQLVDAELALGRLAEAGEWTRRATDAAACSGLPAQRAEACHALARLLLAEGNANAAAASARSAEVMFARGGLSAYAADTRTLVGCARVATGDRAGAVEELESAYRELDALGAVRARDRAARELRGLAHRVPRRGRPGNGESDGVAALSGRAREVAELIAQGMTNKQIAAALFLSQRTIEDHVSQLFRKLGVSSRTEVAREIARVGPAA
jgi:DNA-binding CsgD family transcriptional regulator